MSKVVGILQPGYLPWLGFFEQLLYSDEFVLYDDVQYDKNGWRNRNRVKGPQGPVWLTVPVQTKSLGQPLINQVPINPTQPNWPQKHLGSLRQFYGKAPFFKDYFPALQETLAQPWEKLIDLDRELIVLLAGWLGIHTPLILSSQLDCPHDDPSERLILILKKLEADIFYEGASGQNYLDLKKFEDVGLQVVFQDYQPKPYPQQYGGFQPFLSVVDLIFNCGPESKNQLAGLNCPPLPDRMIGSE